MNLKPIGRRILYSLIFLVVWFLVFSKLLLPMYSEYKYDRPSREEVRASLRAGKAQYLCVQFGGETCKTLDIFPGVNRNYCYDECNDSGVLSLLYFITLVPSLLFYLLLSIKAGIGNSNVADH